MAFVNYGLAKGLTTNLPWDSMINQENKKFSMANEIDQQNRSRAEADAAKMELGTVYDDYNRGRYNDYVEGLMTEIADFDLKNPGYEYNPNLLAKRNAIMNKFKNNDIILESQKTKEQADLLYNFIATNPGSENLPEIKQQLSELSSILKNGNTNGEQKGFLFKSPSVRDLYTEMDSIISKSVTKDIKYDSRSLFTETRLDEGALKTNVEQYMLNPMNMALVKQAFAALPSEQQLIDGNPKQMMLRLAKASFLPEKSNPTQLYKNSSGSRTTKPTTPDYVIDHYAVDIAQGGATSQNPQLRANIMSTFNEEGKQIVDNRAANGNIRLGYYTGKMNKKGVETVGAIEIPEDVEVLDGSELITFAANQGTGKPVHMVKGRAKFTIPIDNTDKDSENYPDNVITKYEHIPGLKYRREVLDNNGNEGLVFTMPALFTAHDNPGLYNQYVGYMFNGEMPQTFAKQGITSVKELKGYKPGQSSSQPIQVNDIVRRDGRWYDAVTGEELGPDGMPIKKE